MNTDTNTKEYYFSQVEFKIIKINNEVYDLEIGDITITLDLKRGNSNGNIAGLLYGRYSFWIDEYINPNIPIYVNKLVINNLMCNPDTLIASGEIILYYNNEVKVILEGFSPEGYNNFFDWIIIDDDRTVDNTDMIFETFDNLSLLSSNSVIMNDLAYIDAILPDVPRLANIEDYNMQQE